MSHLQGDQYVNAAGIDPFAKTQFTCFASTSAQILTPEELQGDKYVNGADIDPFANTDWWSAVSPLY